MKALPPEEDLRNIRDKNEKAISEIYERCWARCAAYLRSRCWHEELKPDEIFSRAFMDFVEKVRDDLDFELRIPTCQWLKGSIRFVILDAWKDLKRRGMISSIEEIEEPIDDSLDDNKYTESRSRIAKALMKLGRMCRELLYRTFFLDQNDEDIGNAMQIPYQQVRRKRYRCVRKLRLFFGK